MKVTTGVRTSQRERRVPTVSSGSASAIQALAPFRRLVDAPARRLSSWQRQRRTPMGAVRMQAVVLSACMVLAPSDGLAQEPFYKGKRLTVLINFAAGGPADIEGRIFAKYLVKHIDGAPSLVVQNMDGAGGLIGAQYLGEIAPKDGTVLGALTGTAWIYASDPERWRVDFRNYEFVARQPSTTIHFVRTDVPPGIKEPTDIVKAKGLIAGGLSADTSKDLRRGMARDL